MKSIMEMILSGSLSPLGPSSPLPAVPGDGAVFREVRLCSHVMLIRCGSLLARRGVACTALGRGRRAQGWMGREGCREA